MSFLKGILFITLLSVSSITFADSAVCPLGPKEDHLTIHRVMLNFGKYIREADGIALKDIVPEQVVTDAQLTKAISDLNLEKACADAVIANPTGDLLPDAAAFLKGEQREKLISDFLSFMNQYSDGVVDYQAALVDVLNTPEADRNYHQVYLNYKSLDKLAMRAHRETAMNSNEDKAFATNIDKDLVDLDAAMKQIGVDFSQIKKTVSIAANNAINAQAAKQMAALFEQVMNQIPDAIQSLPADQRSAATEDFQNLIQQEINLSAQLASAFEQNNNAAAAAIVQQMSAIKMDGHDRYDP